MWIILSRVLIVLGVIFIFFGIVGIFRFKNVYTRLLVSAKVDIVGFITIMTGVIISRGIDYFSLKVGLIIIIMIFTSPLIAHSIARSAFFSGFMQPTPKITQEITDNNTENDVDKSVKL